MDEHCKAKLDHVRKVQASSIRFNPLLRKSCEEDLKRLQEANKCSGAEEQLKGRRIDCLTDNRNDINESKCSLALATTLRQQSDDLRSVPQMFKACADDVKTLC